MKDIEVKQVIISNLSIRGNGTNIPLRRILQVYELDGTLIAEKDPCKSDMLNLDGVEPMVTKMTTAVALMNNENKSQNLITKAIAEHVWDIIGHIKNINSL